MAIVGPLPNNIQDGQIADAVPVMANYNWIVNQVNANAASTAYVTTSIATAVAALGPAGGVNQVQFDNSGVFGGSPLFIWDGANVTVGNPASPGSGNGILCAGAITSTHNSTITGLIGASLRFDTVLGYGYISCYNWNTSAYLPFTIATTQFGLQNATGGAYKATLDLNGSWLVGYTSTNSPTYLLQVNSQIYATNATIATSDARVKENIVPLTAASDIVRSLKPVTFDFKEHEVHNFSKERQIGFLAQDIQNALANEAYLPCIVQEGGACTKGIDDENGIEVRKVSCEALLGVADAKLIPLIVKAWQEHDEEIKALRAELASMRGAA